MRGSETSGAPLLWDGSNTRRRRRRRQRLREQPQNAFFAPELSCAAQVQSRHLSRLPLLRYRVTPRMFKRTKPYRTTTVQPVASRNKVCHCFSVAGYTARLTELNCVNYVAKLLTVVLTRYTFSPRVTSLQILRNTCMDGFTLVEGTKKRLNQHRYHDMYVSGSR